MPEGISAWHLWHEPRAYIFVNRKADQASGRLGLPSGFSYELIGIAAQLGEEQAAGVVEEYVMDFPKGHPGAFGWQSKKNASAIYASPPRALAELCRSLSLNPEYTLILKATPL